MKLIIITVSGGKVRSNNFSSLFGEEEIEVVSEYKYWVHCLPKMEGIKKEQL